MVLNLRILKLYTIALPKTINFNNQQGDIEINMDLLNQIINS